MPMPLLSIIIPIYNEEKIVAESLPAIFNLSLDKEVVVVNDGSTDDTLNILKHLKLAHSFKLIDQASNQGKGAAVKRGLEEINGKYFIVADADLEYDPREIAKLLSLAQGLNGQKLAVYGSRFLGKRSKTFHYLVNSFLTRLTNILFQSKLTDMETCFKLIPSSALGKIKLSGKRFEIEPEITAQLLKNKYEIKELPISYNRRGYKEGKKITPKDGWLAIKTLLKERLNK